MDAMTQASRKGRLRLVKPALVYTLPDTTRWVFHPLAQKGKMKKVGRVLEYWELDVHQSNPAMRRPSGVSFGIGAGGIWVHESGLGP